MICPSMPSLSPVRFVLIATALILTGCPADPSESDAGASAVSLLSLWSEVQVENAVPPSIATARAEIYFDGTTEGASWHALQGVENLRVEDGRLVGRTTSEQPVILIELAQPAGEGDELWSVQTRLEVSGGSLMGVHPVLEPGPPMPVNVTRIDDWPITSPLLPGAGTRTYTTELDNVFLLEMRPATREPQKVLLRPTNASGAEFAIDSVRLVFRREHLAGIESGPGWHGLGEVFREALVSRGSETLTFDTVLPARPWLELAVGAVDEPLPRFEVAVSPVDRSGAAGEAVTLAELRPEMADAWHSGRIGLSEWAGRPVKLHLRATPGDASADGSGSDGAPAFWGTPTVRGSLAPEGTAPSDESAPPQAVVLFLADTLRSDHLGAWGHDRETAPTLSRLAAEGARFQDAVAQSTWTKVSVSSILTSLYPSTTGVARLSDRLSASETTLAEVFRQAGFATFATSSVPFTGQLTNLHQGVEVLYEAGAMPRRDDFHPKTSKVWVDAYLDWLELHRDVPTFAFVHVMDPHSPFEPEEPYDTLWATADDAALFAEQGDAVRPHISHPLMQRFLAPSRQELEAAGVDPDSFVQHEKNWYDGSIRAMDVEVERMMAGIADLGLGERTLLGFVSDHGEEFLDHGRHWHGTTVYGEVANVPLALWGVGVPPGTVVEQTVQTIDLYPTLVELAGLEAPERVQGQSLVPLLRGDPARQRPVFTELPSDRPGVVSRYAVIDGGWKLVWNHAHEPGATDRTGEEENLPKYELYDHASDPLNLHDVSARHPEEVESLAVQLERWRTWAEAQELDESQATAEMSAEELEQLRSLGYVE